MLIKAPDKLTDFCYHKMRGRDAEYQKCQMPQKRTFGKGEDHIPLLFTTDVADACSLGCKMDLTVPQGLG